MDNINEQLQHMQEEIDTLRTLVESNAETIQANAETIQVNGEALKDVQEYILAPTRHRTGEDVVAEVQANKRRGMKRKE